MSMSSPVPNIPVRLLHRPTLGGMVVPWITLRLPDGTFRFGALDTHRAERALRERRCQICGHHLDDLIVFFLRDRDLARMISAEAGAHPECAAYSVAACGMLAGRVDHYSRRPVSATIDAGIALITGDPTRTRAGAPAEQYHRVFTRGDYTVITDPAVRQPAALLSDRHIVRIRRFTPRPQAALESEK